MSRPEQRNCGSRCQLKAGLKPEPGPPQSCLLHEVHRGVRCWLCLSGIRGQVTGTCADTTSERALPSSPCPASACSQTHTPAQSPQGPGAGLGAFGGLWLGIFLEAPSCSQWESACHSPFKPFPMRVTPPPSSPGQVSPGALVNTASPHSEGARALHPPTDATLGLLWPQMQSFQVAATLPLPLSTLLSVRCAPFLLWPVAFPLALLVA